MREMYISNNINETFKINVYISTTTTIIITITRIIIETVLVIKITIVKQKYMQRIFIISSRVL